MALAPCEGTRLLVSGDSRGDRCRASCQDRSRPEAVLRRTGPGLEKNGRRGRNAARGWCASLAVELMAEGPNPVSMTETSFEKLILERQFVGVLQAHAEVFFRLS